MNAKKAHQGAMVIIAVIGGSGAPPVAPGTPRAMYIGAMCKASTTGRKIR